MPEIKINVTAPVIVEPPKPHATIELEARKTLDGNILIMDHEQIDVVIYPEKNKILALAKYDFHDLVYETQDRFFNHLYKSGIIDLGSVHCGNVYGSMEGAILESTTDGIDSLQMTMLAVDKFMDTERPYFMISKAYDRAEAERLTEPDPEDSTELGEVDSDESKGTLGTADAYGADSTRQQRGRQYT